MKNIIILFLLSITLFGCKKDIKVANKQDKVIQDDSHVLKPVSGYSSERRGGIPGKPLKNNQVSDLQTTAISTTEIQYSFSGAAGFYYLYRDGVTIIDASGQLVVVSPGTHIDGGLTPNTAYCYQVKPVSGGVLSNQSCATTFKVINPPPPPPTSDAAVLFVDFDGQDHYTNASWGLTDMTIEGSGLTQEEIGLVLDTMRKDWAQFNVIITNDENAFNAATGKKQKLFVTQTSWRYAGGVAFIGSIDWGGTTEAWVFSALLSYNWEYIARAASHEFGHTTYAYHEVYNCGESYAGINLETDGQSWCPIMGGGYGARKYWYSDANYAIHLAPYNLNMINNNCITQNTTQIIGGSVGFR